MCVCSGNIARCRQAGITHTSNKLTQFFNHCYEFIFNAPRMWKLAKLYCQIHGGALLSIDTLTEEEYIYQILAQSRAMENDIWVGLSDLEQEGIYRWSNGKHAFCIMRYVRDTPKHVYRFLFLTLKNQVNSCFMTIKHKLLARQRFTKQFKISKIKKIKPAAVDQGYAPKLCHFRVWLFLLLICVSIP